MSSFYSNYDKIVEILSPQGATKKIESEGFELIKVVEQITTTPTKEGLTVNTKIVYVLGHLKPPISERKLKPKIDEKKETAPKTDEKKTVAKREAYTKHCNNCKDTKIIMMPIAGDKWKPMDMDGTDHRCNTQQ